MCCCENMKSVTCNASIGDLQITAFLWTRLLFTLYLLPFSFQNETIHSLKAKSPKAIFD
jgi:hypothetical protein